LLNFGTVTFLKFAVYSRSGTLLFEKTWEDFVIDVQQATIYLVPEDTRGNFGLQRWELQYSEIVDDQTLITTIGKGNFVINKELIP
jgi:hypothetical protein